MAKIKKLTKDSAIKCALFLLEEGCVEEAQHVLEFWESLYLDGNVLVTENEAGDEHALASKYMPLGFPEIEIFNKAIAAILEIHKESGQVERANALQSPCDPQ
jgi:hypothetical protein